MRASWSAPLLFATPQRQVFPRRGPYRFLMNSLTSGNFVSPSYGNGGVDLVQKFKTKSENMNDKKVILV